MYFKSTPCDVIRGVEFGMPKPDPLTPVRRARFQEFCRSKGWGLSGNRWNTTSIAEAISKPVNKASDLLNGHGAFGSKIARDIEDHLGLPGGFFDDFNEWPFPEIERDRFNQLRPSQKIEIQGLVRRAITEFEEFNKGNKPTLTFVDPKRGTPQERRDRNSTARKRSNDADS